MAIVATGTMVYESLRATRKLQKDGISCTIIDMSTVKPLDEEILEEVFDSHRLVVTIEEHTVIGGLGFLLWLNIKQGTIRIPGWR